jgi:hypothetical protein
MIVATVVAPWHCVQDARVATQPASSGHMVTEHHVLGNAFLCVRLETALQVWVYVCVRPYADVRMCAYSFTQACETCRHPWALP